MPTWRSALPVVPRGGEGRGRKIRSNQQIVRCPELLPLLRVMLSPQGERKIRSFSNCLQNLRGRTRLGGCALCSLLFSAFATIFCSTEHCGLARLNLGCKGDQHVPDETPSSRYQGFFQQSRRPPTLAGKTASLPSQQLAEDQTLSGLLRPSRRTRLLTGAAGASVRLKGGREGEGKRD